MSTISTPVYLSAKQMADRFSVGIATIWRWSRTRSDFPMPKRLGENCTRWKLADVENWEANREGAA
jgi:prophage regulatory protein